MKTTFARQRRTFELHVKKIYATRHESSIRALRSLELSWRAGRLAVWVALGFSIMLVFATCVGAWQGWAAYGRQKELTKRLLQLDTRRLTALAAVQAAELPDFVAALPSPPTVATVMQGMQLESDKEGARVVSLQSQDYSPTASTLGHLDLVLSIKASYPAIVRVLRAALDRYSAATVRQLNLIHASSQALSPSGLASTLPAGSLQASADSEARVTLAFWYRPLGVPTLSSQPAVPRATTGSAPPAGVASDSPASGALGFADNESPRQFH